MNFWCSRLEAVGGIGARIQPGNRGTGEDSGSPLVWSSSPLPWTMEKGSKKTRLGEPLVWSWRKYRQPWDIREGSEVNLNVYEMTRGLEKFIFVLNSLCTKKIIFFKTKLV